MKTINYEGLGTFEYPEKWSELTLRKFQELNIIKEDTDEIDKIIKINSALTGIPEDALLALPYTEFNKITNNCRFVFEKTDDSELRYTFEIEGIKYGLSYDIAKMSTGEFLDLDSYVRDQDNMIGNLHYVLAILYRPITKEDGRRKKPFCYDIEKYDSTNIDERAELFLDNVTADICISIMVFSLALGLACMQHTKDSSVQ